MATNSKSISFVRNGFVLETSTLTSYKVTIGSFRGSLDCRLLVLFDRQGISANELETDLYFYHSDHPIAIGMGSSSWITDATGSAYQHIQSLPFGEQFIEQRQSSWDAMYKFTGKPACRRGREKDEEIKRSEDSPNTIENKQGMRQTGYSYFGARYHAYWQAGYDSELSVWLSRKLSGVDPLADKYPSMSAYMYTAGNPVMLVDPDGRSSSPYFDYNGNFLGTDEKGFSGEIYITTKEVFEAHKKDGKVNSKDIQTNEKTKSYSSYHNKLTSEALSKIFTYVLNKMPDIKFDKLYNDKVSIFDGTSIYDSKTNTYVYGYNNADPYSRFGTSKVNDEYKVTVNDDYANELHTVEYIWSSLGVHEYYGHGVKGYSGGMKALGTHYKCFLLQYNHSTFSKLDKDSQDEIVYRTIVV